MGNILRDYVEHRRLSAKTAGAKDVLQGAKQLITGGVKAVPPVGKEIERYVKIPSLTDRLKGVSKTLLEIAKKNPKTTAAAATAGATGAGIYGLNKWRKSKSPVNAETSATLEEFGKDRDFIKYGVGGAGAVAAAAILYKILKGRK